MVEGPSEKNNYETSDFFVGCISPFLLFEMEYHGLFHLVESHKDETFFRKTNPAAEVVVIAMVAHFEAFCKHQFAAIVNILPALLPVFTSKRNEPEVQFSSVISLNGEFEKNIGFVIAEKYDFGSAKSINGLFRDLLLVSPFSEKEATTFNDILSKRNLLVHHAGFYTLQYLKENSIHDEIKTKAFKEAILIDTRGCHEISDFLFQMAIKITQVTSNALQEQMKLFANLSIENYNAAEKLFSAVYDTLE
jgi:hypothetical protein